MPLLLTGQRLPSPACIRNRLGMTHVNWPVQGQWNLFEHRAVQPPFVRLSPEHWMSHRMRGFPIPVVVTPERARLISAGGHEFKELSVRDLILINLKRRHLYCVNFELIVPTEDLAPTRQTQRCRARGNRNHLMSNGRRCGAKGMVGSNFAI